jgi:hypothetical protein
MVARHLGADLASTDPARIMRVPGTLNYKASPPFEVTCERAELDVFELGEVLGELPDSPGETPAPRPATTVRGSLARPLEGLVSVVLGAMQGNRNNALNWASYCAGEHVGAGRLDAEQAGRELRAAALAVGLDEAEARATITSGLRAGAA